MIDVVAELVRAEIKARIDQPLPRAIADAVVAKMSDGRRK